MPGPKPIEIKLSEAEKEALEKLVKGHNTRQQIALRGRIILATGPEKSNSQIRQRVRGEPQYSPFVAQPLVAVTAHPVGGIEGRRAPGRPAATWSPRPNYGRPTGSDREVGR